MPAGSRVSDIRLINHRVFVRSAIDQGAGASAHSPLIMIDLSLLSVT